MAIENLSDSILERTSALLEFTLTDEDGANSAVVAAQVTAMTLTYYDEETGQIINNRDLQSVLDLNNVALDDSTGVVTWSMQPDDSIIVDARKSSERHVASFSWTWGAGKINRYDVSFLVLNINKVS